MVDLGTVKINEYLRELEGKNTDLYLAAGDVLPQLYDWTIRRNDVHFVDRKVEQTMVHCAFRPGVEPLLWTARWFKRTGAPISILAPGCGAIHAHARPELLRNVNTFHPSTTQTADEELRVSIKDLAQQGAMNRFLNLLEWICEQRRMS